MRGERKDIIVQSNGRILSGREEGDGEYSYFMMAPIDKLISDQRVDWIGVLSTVPLLYID